MPDRKVWAALSPASPGVSWLPVGFLVGCGATATEWCQQKWKAAAVETRETWNVINLWWFKLGRSEQQGCGGSFWISAQQESPESKRERSLWGSWLAAHTGVGGFVGILGAPFLGMMEHSSEMPKPALTRADPGNGTRPCPAKSVNQLDESSQALLEWIREWNRS